MTEVHFARQGPVNKKSTQAGIMVVASMMALSTIGMWPGSVLAQAGCGVTVTTGESIQAAIDAAADGDAVCATPGTYPGNVEIDTANLTLRFTGGKNESHTSSLFPSFPRLFPCFTDASDPPGSLACVLG